MSLDLHRIQIVSPTGVPQDSTFLLDGQEIKGLCALSLRVDPNEFITVMLTLEPSTIDVEAGQLIERVFSSRNDGDAIGERHAQRIAEVAGMYPPGTADGDVWREIAELVYSAAVRNGAPARGRE